MKLIDRTLFLGTLNGLFIYDIQNKLIMNKAHYKVLERFWIAWNKVSENKSCNWDSIDDMDQNQTRCSSIKVYQLKKFN